jgi:hypothetical protein
MPLFLRMVKQVQVRHILCREIQKINMKWEWLPGQFTRFSSILKNRRLSKKMETLAVKKLKALKMKRSKKNQKSKRKLKTRPPLSEKILGAPLLQYKNQFSFRFARSIMKMSQTFSQPAIAQKS